MEWPRQAQLWCQPPTTNTHSTAPSAWCAQCPPCPGLTRGTKRLSALLNPTERSRSRRTRTRRILNSPRSSWFHRWSPSRRSLHFGAERDQYFSPRVYALGQVAFDHNFAQDLQLQQIYGGGFGWTAIKSPKQEFDLKGTMQYEKQQFMPGAGSANQNLIGSTFAASYLLHLKLLTYAQDLDSFPPTTTSKPIRRAKPTRSHFPRIRISASR